MITVIFIAVSAALTGILGIFTVQLQRALKNTAIDDEPDKTDTKKPSVTVCIPARNEMHAMSQCLERVLASDYEKLEVIVYDDSSADDTSILVRSFAHAGVRFVPGAELPDGWLGKNHALSVLAEEASGTYALFLDVDTFIEPTTISRLVAVMTGEKLEMLSVIPQRVDAGRASVLFGTLRYFWQLVLSRKSMPASSCALWMIDRQLLLDELQGLAPFKDIVNPERHVAALLGKTHRCILSIATLGVSYEKKWRSQLETGRRVLYPMTGGRWWSGLLAVFVLALLNAPLFTVLSSLYFGWTEIQVMALWLMVAFMAVYGVYTSHVWRRSWWLGGLLWPVIILQELVLLIQSIWGYARHTITWKGRLITAATPRASRIKIEQ